MYVYVLANRLDRVLFPLTFTVAAQDLSSLPEAVNTNTPALSWGQPR